MKVPIRIYKNSFLASTLSILSSLTMIICVAAFLGRAILEGILLLILGVALLFAAEYVSEKKCFKLWIRKLEANGMLAKVAEDNSAAVAMYNANPKKMTLAYIQKLNPDAAAIIARELEVQKAMSKGKN